MKRFDEGSEKKYGILRKNFKLGFEFVPIFNDIGSEFFTMYWGNEKNGSGLRKSENLDFFR